MLCTRLEGGCLGICEAYMLGLECVGDCVTGCLGLGSEKVSELSWLASECLRCDSRDNEHTVPSVGERSAPPE